jgi:hypothetical protein
MGQMLNETERAKGAATKGVGKRGTKGEPRCEKEPTLSDLGLSKKESFPGRCAPSGARRFSLPAGGRETLRGPTF